MKNLVEKILDHIKKGEDVVIATIVNHQGSSPRSTGAKMVIGQSGSTYGTIGGGLMEAYITDQAQRLFRTRESGIVSYDLTPNGLNSMGMTCGGSVEILLDLVSTTPENIRIFSQWYEILKKSRKSYFLIFLTDRVLSSGKPFHGILSIHEDIQGEIPLSLADKNQIRDIVPTINTPHIVQIENYHVVIEPSNIPKTLFIFGAGHVAVPTAAFAAQVGFNVQVIDDREEFAASRRFLSIIETRVVPEFEQALAGIKVNNDDYIVIVTRGHLHDKTVLAQALKTEAAYIGMIGSKNKRDAIYTQLLKEGFTQKDIDRVHCPIGLAIDAETPEEIAVSIVAELIQKRASQMP